MAKIQTHVNTKQQKRVTLIYSCLLLWVVIYVLVLSGHRYITVLLVIVDECQRQVIISFFVPSLACTVLCVVYKCSFMWVNKWTNLTQTLQVSTKYTAHFLRLKSLKSWTCSLSCQLLFRRLFRFDCGSGMGLVRTKNRVLVGDWNHLTVRRRDWKGFVQLNKGPETGTLSKVWLLAFYA